MKYKDYVERWDEISQIFSKDAVLKGSFDKFAGTSKGKRGTSTVDKEFLKEIESWRKNLATHIARQNRELGTTEVNFAVQRTIDRILFLRMCEDRGIEQYEQLLAIKNGREVYRRLGELFEKADAKYNSGLFYFKQEKGRNEAPDELTLGITIPDEPIGWILHNLYYPQSPYEFSVLPAEILGHVYEQFLGKVIRITPGRVVKIEDKPEVKKAGGVYYTPEYIVDYIVKNTVGKLCEGKTPKEISKLRILDPACGSGSFLLGAYTYLLNYHRDWYRDNEPEKHRKQIYQGKGGRWFLTIPEKKRILLNNIYGVDIDYQAVEVTKLSLLLKVLEGENQETVQQVFRSFHERALPDLGNNIKCGNSLIGTDFYEMTESQNLADEDRRRINAFDWQKEFPQILAGKTPGFDAVIGNPPWGADIIKVERKYLSQKHPEVADFESSQYFLLTCTKLLKQSGLIGMIIPNTFALNIFARECRKKILSLGAISQMVDLSEVDVFAGPNVRAMILIVARTRLNQCTLYGSLSRHDTFQPLRVTTQEELHASDTWKPLFTQETPLSKLIDNIVSRSPALLEYCQVRQGYIPYRTSTLTHRFGRTKAEQIVKNRLWHSTKSEGKEYQRELQGKDVERYGIHWSGVWVRYGKWVSTYLPLSLFSGPRVLIREITDPPPHSLLATYAEETFVHNPSILAVLPLPDSLSPKFLLGILNSRLMSQVFVHVAPKAKKGLFAKIIITDAKRLPCPRISLSSPDDKATHDKMVSLVERMLDLYKKLGEAKVPTEKERLQREIGATDKQIDAIVYELYGLTEEEIRIVERIEKEDC
jgi:hypothetical protein